MPNAEICKGGIPEQALRYLAADGMAVKSRWGVWTSTPRTQHRGPQVPLSGGEAR